MQPPNRNPRNQPQLMATLMAPLAAITLGGRHLSRMSSSKMSDVVFLMPSVKDEARSNMPTTGFVTAPTIPLPMPFMSPGIPECLAPSMGLSTIPVMPEAIDVTKDFAPVVMPKSYVLAASFGRT
ncbi:hypothetical protein DI09_64p20 [Mitosporidium daphniae]|uniref:Uncharacterized protein n=1 Tax=Mitosporidium daphniae TaxID=1485682 RepID=A0A098VS48_9MICR|nr:uncharacterized protein DI09_64p20 [Mitosporidium daphniae]KGG50566.1 hypothetical protein DI09_64p20 [Mitosporidium daphniae]|eukprot:XP_013237005.1 uncharacterized protein DI09_64p20 [Mitosporidium daphniae]